MSRKAVISTQFRCQFAPAALDAVSDTLYVPGVLYVTLATESLDSDGEPPWNDQLHDATGAVCAAAANVNVSPTHTKRCDTGAISGDGAQTA